MRTITLILLLQLSLSASAQFFQDVYNFDYTTPQYREDFYNSGIRTRDNYAAGSPAKYYYIGVGASLNNPGLPAPHNQADRYRFTRTNKAGSVINNNRGLEFRNTGSGSPFMNSVGCSISEIADGSGTGGYMGVGGVYDNTITGATLPGGGDALIVNHANTGAVNAAWRLDFSSGNDIALCVRKSVFVPGTWLICGITKPSIAGTTRTDCFVSRVDAGGTVIWAFTFNFDPTSGPVDAACVANQLCEDPASGMIYVVGHIDDLLFMPNINALVFNLSAAGALLGAVIMDAGPPGPGASDDRFRACRFTSDGFIIVGGFSNRSTAASFAGYKMLITKLTPGLVPVFSNLLIANMGTTTTPVSSRCQDIIERVSTTGAIEYYLFGSASPPAGTTQCVYKADAAGFGIEHYLYNGMKFGGGFGIDYVENTLSKPGLVLFSSVDNSSTTFSDAHLMKTYFNGATCTNLCPKNPPDNLPITYNIPLENVFIGNLYDIKKLKSKNYDYQFKQMCSQGSISCGSNARETVTLPLQADDSQYIVYPNPAGNQVTVAWDVMQTSALTIEIRNIHGAIVFNQQLQAGEGRFSTTIDVTSMSPGTYILLIRSNDKVIRKSFIKQ